MRLLHAYLVAYFLLVFGALGALWYGGALGQMPAIWVLMGLIVAVGLGVLLALSAGSAEVTPE